MKNLLNFLVIIAIFVGACKKENSNPNPNPSTPSSDLVGDWAWTQSSGGIAGVTQTPDNQGIIRRYLFTANSLEVNEAGTKVGTTSYSITNEKSLLTGKLENFINLKTENCNGCKLMPKYTFTFSKGKDTLFLNEDVYDGFSHIYVKKRSDGFLAATYTGIDPKLCPTPCCGGFLLNIEGRSYQTAAFPAGFTLDANKKPQKLLVKTTPTVHSCTPIVVNVVEAKWGF